ncbi:MAG: hypothetical protein NC405_07920 [Odoribacter sp.]|nr:hypothetical protein [Odoribacter sp.]
MIITAADLKAEELRQKYSVLLADTSVFPTKANWDYIIDHRMEGIGDLLYKKYIAAIEVDDVDRADLHQIAINEFPRYLGAVSRRYAIDVIYDNTSRLDIFVDLVRKCLLFDADYLADLIRCGELSAAISVIDVYQPQYDESDLDAMNSLKNLIDQLPARGLHEQRSSLFGRSDKYICPNGHVNDGTVQYCTHNGCGLDTYGITREQRHLIDIFIARINALRSLIDR